MNEWVGWVQLSHGRGGVGGTGRGGEWGRGAGERVQDRVLALQVSEKKCIV